MRVGIDLGTSYSRVGRLDPNGRPILVPDSAERQVFAIPSVVYISSECAFIGQRVEDLVEDDPNLAVARCFKEKLGELAVVLESDGAAWLAEGVAAMVMKKLRYDAETDSSNDVDGVVVAVPAGKPGIERGLMTAGFVAGLPVLGTVEEPVAAAWYYGTARSAERTRALVYDFSGTAFRCHVVEAGGGGAAVVAGGGAPGVGGDDVDRVVAEMVLEQFERLLGERPQLTPRAEVELRRISESLKIGLSEPGVKRLRRTVLLGGEAVEVDLERGAFDEGVRGIVERTIAATRECLATAGVAPTELDHVLLAGGNSRLAVVVDSVRRAFQPSGAEVLSLDPDRAVALGATLYAAHLSAADRPELPPELTGVTAHAVGIRTFDQETSSAVIDTLIRKDLPLPATVRKTYYTTRPDQRRVAFHVLAWDEGPGDEESLGTIVVDGISEPRINYPIDLTVEYDEGGSVSVRARDPHAEEGVEKRFSGGGSTQIVQLASQRGMVTATTISD